MAIYVTKTRSKGADLTLELSGEGHELNQELRDQGFLS